MFYVKLFKKTGFNLVNVPDSIQLLLDNYTGYDYPVIDILQLFHNTKIKLKVNNGEKDIMTTDFLLLSNRSDFNPIIHPAQEASVAAYTVDGYTMLNGDTVELQVTMEPFLTAGGKNIHFLDGMTVRHHVAKNDDKFGEYIEDDPLLVPSKAPQVKFKGAYFNADGTQGDLNSGMIVESSCKIDAGPMIQCDADLVISNDGNLIDGVTGDPGHRMFTSFQSEPPADLEVVPDYKAGKTRMGSSGIPVNKFDCFTMYALAQADTPNFINRLKEFYEWGLSDMIKGAYTIPGFWWLQGVDIRKDSDNKIEHIFTSAYKIVPNIPIISGCDGNGGWTDANFAKMNKRVWSGKNNEFIFLATGSGAVQSRVPEMLKGVGQKPYGVTYSNDNYPVSDVCQLLNVDDEDKKIMLFGWCDPRPGGGPKFHVVSRDDEYGYSTIGPTVEEDGFIFKDVIKGGTWKNVNLALTAIAGGRVNQIDYNQKRILSDFSTEVQALTGYRMNYSLDENMNPIMYPLKQSISDVGNDIRQMEEKNYGMPSSGSGLENFGLASSVTTSQWMDAAYGGSQRAAAYLAREAQARAEAMQYIASNIPKPIVAMTGEYDEDPAGDCLLVFQVVPDRADLLKYNKILNQYGYRITERLSTAHMNNRPKYNYIQATGVSIDTNYNVPKSVRDDAAIAFSQGLRIWHTKPDPSLYEQWDGGNVPQEVNNNV